MLEQAKNGVIWTRKQGEGASGAKASLWRACKCSMIWHLRRGSLHLSRMVSPSGLRNHRSLTQLGSGHGLRDLATATLKEGLQWTDSNKIVGLESRVAILRNLGRSLLAHSEIFGDDGRPGHLVGEWVSTYIATTLTIFLDYMIANSPTPDTLDVLLLWDILQKVLIPIWPKDRTVVDGSAIGDAWPLNTLRKNAKSGGDAGEIQPFHKLTQWLTYSLLTPFEQVLKKRWTNVKSLTVLPEYRNGGLLVDLGVLSLKQAALDRGLKASNQSLPRFAASDDVIVEWRALTIALLDVLHPLIVERMETGVDLTMVRVLEAGTWRSGREVAAERRPKTKSSPILIESDGTVF